MSEQVKNIELYQDYLSDSLNESERAQFEKRIESDNEFFKDFAEYKQLESIITEVYEVQEARKEIANLIDFDKPLEGDDLDVAASADKPIRIKLFTMLSVAASLALIWLVWQPSKMSSSEVVRFGFAAVQNEAISLYYPSDNIGNEGVTRDYSDIRDLELAIASFKEGSFEKSKARLLLLLERLESKKSVNNLNIISWIMLCDINTGSAENISTLYSENFSWVKKLEVNNPNEYDFFRYVYSLHLLNEKKNREAKNTLESIVKRGGKYSGVAKNLQEEIRFLLP
jgi:hypothetical protein